MLLYSSIPVHLNDLFLCVFTLLISNTTASLASGLARCLAFATATVLCALAKVTSFKSLNSFHCCILHSRKIDNDKNYHHFHQYSIKLFFRQ